MNAKPRIICHRANLYGPDPKRENTLSSIQECLDLGRDVEVDVRIYGNQLFFGHDEPQERVPLDFLTTFSERLWIHCKCIDSLFLLIKYESLNVFFHDQDEVTLTSKKYLWTFPGKITTPQSIMVALSLEATKLYITENLYGVCTDFALMT